MEEAKPENCIPHSIHVMAKPAGAACNLRCRYCFYLGKERLYPDGELRMSDAVLESYLRQTVQNQRVPEVTIAWQGGEPTLVGIDFFRRAIGFEQKHLKRSMRVERTLQTNGILLDDEWCRFLRKHGFLVGLSLDGPRGMHDAFRRDRAGQPTFDRVLRAARLLQEHQVEFNILAAVHSANGDHPLEVYRFFRDSVGARFLQFIPIVERENSQADSVTDRSVGARQYGRFLSAVFDEWVRRDVGEMFVLNIDGPLANWLGSPSLCLFSAVCGQAVALEHNGDLYSCDHFVEPDHLLGNILSTTIAELVSSEKQLRFGLSKRDRLPRRCRECGVLFACNGECPKNRFLKTPEGEPGLNYLCEGYKQYFSHIQWPMRILASLVRSGQDAAKIMRLYDTEKQVS